MLVVAYCLDAPDKLQQRLETRPAHLAFLGSLGDRLKLAGPMMDAAGERPVGSMLILEAESVEEAERILWDDPYQTVELFETVAVKPWRGALGTWLPQNE